MPRSRPGGGAYKNGGGAPESKRAEDASPFDKQVLVDGAPCMGRWQFSSHDNEYYFVHADGKYVTPVYLCTLTPLSFCPCPSRTQSPISSDDDQTPGFDEVEDGADYVYMGPNGRYNFFFYTSPEGSEEVLCAQSSALADVEDLQCHYIDTSRW